MEVSERASREVRPSKVSEVGRIIVVTLDRRQTCCLGHLFRCRVHHHAPCGVPRGDWQICRRRRRRRHHRWAKSSSEGRRRALLRRQVQRPTESLCFNQDGAHLPWRMACRQYRFALRRRSRLEILYEVERLRIDPPLWATKVRCGRKSTARTIDLLRVINRRRCFLPHVFPRSLR